jgi:nucleoside-diphosphate-sugar epimerase
MAQARSDREEAWGGTRVLVTGGAGFIGSHLARRLAGLGAEVRVIDDLSSGSRENLAGVDVDLRMASILDEGASRAVMDGCRFVFHEAAMVSVPLSVDDPPRCAEINIIGTERVLEAACAAGVQRVVFASSAAVYGDEPNLPSTERDPIDCRSPYAASKAAGEALMTAFGRCYDISTVSLRYFNIYGPRQDPNSPYAAVIAAFLSALRAGRPPTIFGDGRQTRDFTCVDDVVEANLRAATCAEPLSGEIINIGTGTRSSLLDVLAAIRDALGVDVAPRFEAERTGDVRHSVADISKAQAMIGYEPSFGLAEGMTKLASSART